MKTGNDGTCRKVPTGMLEMLPAAASPNSAGLPDFDPQAAASPHVVPAPHNRRKTRLVANAIILMRGPTRAKGLTGRASSLVQHYASVASGPGHCHHLQVPIRLAAPR